MAGDEKHNCVTSFESYSFEYEWKISNVDGRTSNPNPVVCPEDIKSPPGKYPATTWRLEALKATDKGYEVSLTLISRGFVWACVTLSAKTLECLETVQNLAGEVESKYGFVTKRFLNCVPACQVPATVQMYYGQNFRAYIPKERLQNYYLSDKPALIIHCSIFVNKLNTPVHVVNNSSPTEIQLHTSGHNLSRVLEDARHKDRYTDVTIVTEGKEFKAHKLVLATQSPFFETRLEKRWTEESGSRIDMQDVPAITMDTILTYMYTGKVENIDKVACELLPKAEEYQLEGLKVKCEAALSKSLTAQTVIDILLMADTHNAGNLKQSCLVFLTGHITDVKKSSAWTEGRLKTKKELWMEVLEHIADSL